MRTASSGEPIAISVIADSGSGSRPSRSHASAIRPRISRHFSGDGETALYSSAQRAASATLRGLPAPPTTIGGCGCCTPFGRGSDSVSL